MACRFPLLRVNKPKERRFTQLRDLLFTNCSCFSPFFLCLPALNFQLHLAGSRGFLSRKLVLLLTDGESNVNKQNTVPNAQKLKDKGVEVFVIAVGGQHMLGIEEMAKVATFPPADFLFRVEKVGHFFEVVQLAIEEVAPGKYKLLKPYVSSSCMV
jgi:hypothetical protein